MAVTKPAFPTRPSFSTAPRERLFHLSHLRKTLNPGVPVLPVMPASLDTVGQWLVCRAGASPTEDPCHRSSIQNIFSFGVSKIRSAIYSRRILMSTLKCKKTEFFCRTRQRNKLQLSARRTYSEGRSKRYFRMVPGRRSEGGLFPKERKVYARHLIHPPQTCIVPQTGSTFQIFFAYSRIERSLENLPMRATFKIARRAQTFFFRKSLPVRSCASR